MTGKLKKYTVLGLVSTVYSIILFIWFTNIEGMLGTFNWHIEYKSIYILMCILLPFPPVMMFLNQIFKNRKSRFFLYFFSILNITIWSLWYISLTVLVSIPVDHSGLNIIRQAENIPSGENTEDEPKIHLAFASDPHWGSSRSDKEARINILKAVNSGNYDGFYILGDIVEMGMLAGDYRLAVNDLREYLPDMRFRTIPGNHDVILNGVKLYDSIFQVKGEKHYFRQDNGTIHFLFINMLWDESELTGKELKWLEAQLKEIPQDDTVIVISHCYVVSSGVYDSLALKNWGDLPKVMKKLCPILEKYNVDLYLSGHDHFFEDLSKDGVDYLVLGAMGGALDNPLTYHSPYSNWVNNEVHGFVDMKIYDDYLTYDCVSSDGDIIYSKRIETK